ncbi:MAG TPA: hypothetical protein VE621_21715 [Bryobacteraceae bacterium]|nr:hypothetical protein [Bryobacteraceae bacterium]
MAKFALVHWNESEAEARVREASSKGVGLELLRLQPGRTVQTIRSVNPEALLIDLTRMPSNGRAVASVLRSQRSTCHIPILFVGGEPQKVEKALADAPGSQWCEWENIAKAIPKLLATAPKTVAKHHSEVPVAKKLNLLGGKTICVLNAPESFLALLESVDGLTVHDQLNRKFDSVLLFTTTMNELEAGLAAIFRRTFELPLTLAWPKRASGADSELSMPLLREYLKEFGYIDYKVASIDKTWSAMLFSRARKRDSTAAQQSKT